MTRPKIALFGKKVEKTTFFEECSVRHTHFFFWLHYFFGCTILAPFANAGRRFVHKGGQLPSPGVSSFGCRKMVRCGRDSLNCGGNVVDCEQGMAPLYTYTTIPLYEVVSLPICVSSIQMP